MSLSSCDIFDVTATFFLVTFLIMIFLLLVDPLISLRMGRASICSFIFAHAFVDRSRVELLFPLLRLLHFPPCTLFLLDSRYNVRGSSILGFFLNIHTFPLFVIASDLCLRKTPAVSRWSANRDLLTYVFVDIRRTSPRKMILLSNCNNYGIKGIHTRNPSKKS